MLLYLILRLLNNNSMKTKLTKLIVLSAVALFATSCAKLPNISLPDCGEWKVPKLTDWNDDVKERDIAPAK